ncbi:hypothetical protein NA29_24135 [Pandoraea sputorum]|nr:hypothetical protein NA29_24135 [Pandoraea sputorum]
MWLDIKFDANWVDCGAAISGISYVAWQTWRTRQHGVRRPIAISHDFAFGVAFFPQLLLLICVMSSTIVDGLVNASRISLCVAGSYALGAMWDAQFVGRSCRDRRSG